jgi:hypothetical protein
LSSPVAVVLVIASKATLAVAVVEQVVIELQPELLVEIQPPKVP